MVKVSQPVEMHLMEPVNMEYLSVGSYIMILKVKTDMDMYLYSTVLYKTVLYKEPAPTAALYSYNV